MRHRPLHAALSTFAEEAAWQLTEETSDGADVPFEIIESRGARRDVPLYCYRPLTESFIRDRVGVLELLPSYPAAARALAGLDGVGDYLRAHGEPRVPVEARERADAALRLYDPVRVVLGPVAWERSGAGAWTLGDLGAGGGRPRGELTIAESAEDELRGFCNLVARRTPRGGELAWALRRYELGCERPS